MELNWLKLSVRITRGCQVGRWTLEPTSGFPDTVRGQVLQEVTIFRRTTANFWRRRNGCSKFQLCLQIPPKWGISSPDFGKNIFGQEENFQYAEISGGFPAQSFVLSEANFRTKRKLSDRLKFRWRRAVKWRGSKHDLTWQFLVRGETCVPMKRFCQESRWTAKLLGLYW